jgi:serine acetyltransferase
MTATTWKSTLSAISEDKKVYPKWWNHSGFWVVFFYRVRRLRKHGIKIWICLLPFDVLFSLIRAMISDTVIPASVSVGPGLYLAHANGIIINDQVKIGSHVCLFQQVTLGEWHGGAPTIEDHVRLFAGCKVFGSVTLEKHCTIGANTVISSDVAAHSTVYPAGNQIKLAEHPTEGQPSVDSP